MPRAGAHGGDVLGRATGVAARARLRCAAEAHALAGCHARAHARRVDHQQLAERVAQVGVRMGGVAELLVSPSAMPSESYAQYWQRHVKVKLNPHISATIQTRISQSVAPRRTSQSVVRGSGRARASRPASEYLSGESATSMVPTIAGVRLFAVLTRTTQRLLHLGVAA